MKTILQKITLLIFISVSACKISSAQIPNNDFESWYVSPMFGENPTQWYSSNGDLLPYNVFKDSVIKYSGNYSVQLANIIGARGSIYGYFPITFHPQTLNGYFKSDFTGVDTGSIKVILYFNQQKVDSGEYLITTSLTNWTNISCPISQSSVNADSFDIIISDGHIQQNILWVDHLNFDSGSGIPCDCFNSMTVYPNPCSDYIFIGGLKNSSSLTIYDLNGSVIKTFANKNKPNDFIDVADLSNGIYFLEIESEGKFYRKSFVKK